MNGWKNILITFGFTVSVSLIASAVSVLIFTYHYDRLQFNLLNAVCGEIAKQQPEAKKTISAALKVCTGNIDNRSEEDILSALGYRVSDFSGANSGQNISYMAAGFLTGIFLFTVTFLYRNKREAGKIQALAEYLEQVNTGRSLILSASGEGEFSKLEDEIYKTVTYLCQTKEAAVQAKNHFAENMSNIAHQLKTPITAISLSVQMIKQDLAVFPPLARRTENDTAAHAISHLEQIKKQLLRLTHLEEALLILSRIDAGTLLLQKNETDVYTILVLAADNLQELFAHSGTVADIPEQGGMMMIADPDWTMEAVMNLMKNCMEYGNGGIIHCSYSQNPLYTEILIWDEGKGFAKEDIPHLFERFYRGQNASKEGIGIGLALAKEIIEHQNGTLRAQNRPDGGALFEIRFYSH